jgi:phenylalanyl-tRNA synthetase beta subunit
MREVADLIVEIAGGEIIGFVNEYPKPQEARTVTVSISQVKRVLGDTFGEAEIKNAFDRLGFAYSEAGEIFSIAVPFERVDITIPEDLCEEVGRIIGYDHVPATPLPPTEKSPEVNAAFYTSEKVREEYVSQGYSEIFTSVFADAGERIIANKVDGTRPYLRTSLIAGLQEALEKNARNKDLLGIAEVKLFEIGTVWKGGKEIVMIGSISEKEKAQERPLTKEISKSIPTEYEFLPLSNAVRYQSFSKYPFIVRDIALWTPKGTLPEDVLTLIAEKTGDLLVRSAHIDTYEKGEKVSLAFRLIFQSFEKTLTDAEVAEVMKKVTDTLVAKGFEVR